MAEYLDTDLAIVYSDPDTKELKATPYFEDYLFQIVRGLGGEGSTLVSDLAAASLDMDKIPYLTNLVKRLGKQVEEIGNTVDSPILDAKVKSMQKKLSELEAHFDIHRLEGVVRQLEIDTMGFVGKVKFVSYTAFNKDWVEGRANAVITLPADPLPNDQVIVSNGDGSTIKVLSNGTDIKYTSTDTTLTIQRMGTSLHFQVFEDESTKYWRIR